MSFRSKYALIGVLVVLLAGAFVWRYGDTTGGIDPEDEALTRGWRQIDDVALPAIAQELPGIHGSADGIPLEGTYLVNFWATTCGPCKVEMPWLQQLHDKGGAEVLGVTRDNIIDNAERFLDRRGVTYPNVSDEFGDFMAAIGDVVSPAALPATILIEDGRIIWARSGSFDSYEDLRDSVTDRL